MGYKILDQGITLTLPTVGTTNWANQLESTTWFKLSGHDHTGGGNGLKLTSSALAANIALTKAGTLVPTGTSQTIDFNFGNIQVLDLGSASGDVTLTLDNGLEGGFYQIIIIQGNPARNILAWNVTGGSVKWPQGQELIISTADDAIDKVTLLFDGVDYLADWNLDYK